MTTARWSRRRGRVCQRPVRSGHPVLPGAGDRKGTGARAGASWRGTGSPCNSFLTENGPGTAKGAPGLVLPGVAKSHGLAKLFFRMAAPVVVAERRNPALARAKYPVKKQTRAATQMEYLSLR